MGVLDPILKIEKMQTMVEKLQAPRGTRDLIGRTAEAFARYEAACRRVFAQWNYEEIRPPTFEEAALFARSLGETTDVVEKEMFTFERSERLYALRPEGTASVVRAFIEHAMACSMKARTTLAVPSGLKA